MARPSGSLNAFLVLPLTDEGIAGSRHINTVGLIAFALAHMSFFLVLSVLYGFRERYANHRGVLLSGRNRVNASDSNHVADLPLVGQPIA